MPLTVEQFTSPGKYEIDLAFEEIDQKLKESETRLPTSAYKKEEPYTPKTGKLNHTQK